MRRTILALAIAGLSVAAYASPPPGGGAQPPLNVNVTNPVLPVEISNADPIKVETVASAENPALQGFAHNGGITSFTSSNLTVTDALLTVPAGKIAVIEHVSCINYLETGNNFVRMELVYTLNGAPQRHQFVHSLVGGSLLPGTDVWSFSQPISAYADPNTEISVSAIRRSSTGSGGIECQISGHYVDAP